MIAACLYGDVLVLMVVGVVVEQARGELGWRGGQLGIVEYWMGWANGRGGVRGWIGRLGGGGGDSWL